MDTIVALSSGALPSAVAVVRASGASTKLLVECLVGALPKARQVTYCVLRDGDGREIDRGLVLWFPSPASFTGEDSAEFHVHGSKAVVERVLALATAMPDVRSAEPGEFARRAFNNGKLDLTGAEALADLISAETEIQRQFAVQQAAGWHAALYDAWRDRLLHARAMIEAEIDFADEDDVPGSVSEQIWADVDVLMEEINRHIAGERRGRIMRSGFEIALIGRPNVGKSTLLNRLAGSERAIVSSIPGTTRDVVDVRLDLDGYLVTVADTAGLRDSDDCVEAEGMRRALERAEEADLVLHLDDEGRFAPLSLRSAGPVWRVHTKSDLNPGVAREGVGADWLVSAVTGYGIGGLVEGIKIDVKSRVSGADGLAPGRERHVECLNRALDSLRRARTSHMALEVRAEYLRLAGDELGRITGRVDVEDMLGVIFSRFCVGK